MRPSFVVAMTFAGLTSLASCSSSPSAPTEPTVVTLAPGASGMAGGLRIKLIRVTADSRCPGDALCIWPGDAQVAIEVDGFAAQKSAELHLADPAKKTIIAGIYTVTFDALTPYPFLSLGPIVPANYRATFKVGK